MSNEKQPTSVTHTSSPNNEQWYQQGSVTSAPITHIPQVFIPTVFTPNEQPKQGQNPKDILGVKKVSFTKFPSSALAHGAHAMMNGASKYGPYNWRGNKVLASIYVDACMRHMNAWFDGEETASDSGVHHLGHALACLAIILDAQETGNLIDDRPSINNGAFVRLMERLNKAITENAKEK